VARNGLGRERITTGRPTMLLPFFRGHRTAAEPTEEGRPGPEGSVFILFTAKLD